MDSRGRWNEWLGSGVLEYPISIQKAESPLHPCASHMGHHLSLGGPLRVPLSFSCDPWPCISLTIFAAIGHFFLKPSVKPHLGFPPSSPAAPPGTSWDRDTFTPALLFLGRGEEFFFNSCYNFLIKNNDCCKIHITKFTNLTICKHTVQWY